MKIHLALPLALCLALALAACGSDSGGGSSGEGPKVVATTGILADITGQVAGEDAAVERLIPEGASPHDFQLSAKGRAEIEDAVLLVHNGSGLETGVPVADFDVPAFALTEHAGPPLSSEEEDGHDEADEHAEESEHAENGGDPHVWMDPTRIAAALPALAEALAEADPEHAAGYRQRAETYADELTALDAELERTLEAVPAANRELVTSHDALGYFADRYGFEVVATAFSAAGVESEASAGRIDEVERAVRETGVPAVFAEREDDPEVLELIAEETGVEVVDGLMVESPGDGTYIEMLQADAALIVEGLGSH